LKIRGGESVYRKNRQAQRQKSKRKCRAKATNF
jgi:hypothetical protein